MLKKVVFPAPFGPISETIAPRGTVKSTSLLATSPPNSLRSCRVSRSASGTSGLRVVQRFVVHAFVQLGCTPLRRDQAFGPEEHDDDDDHAVDSELVQRHVQVRVEV